MMKIMIQAFPCVTEFGCTLAKAKATCEFLALSIT